MAHGRDISGDSRDETYGTELSHLSPEIESLPSTLRSPASPSYTFIHRESSAGNLDDHLLYGHEPIEPDSNTGQSRGDLTPPEQHGLSRRYLLHACLTDWGWELASIALSIGCMAAIIVVLITTDGKSLSEWHMSISPNTVVSIFSTFVKSSMLLVMTECISQLKWIYFQQKSHSVAELELFDFASRGPLGSLKLLWHINWRAVLSSSCAILILLALAMDPFAQQILQYSTQDVLTRNGTASLQFARHWRFVETDQTSSHASEVQQLREQSAVYQVLIGANRQANFQCSTGNCTWPEYASLGVCCDCADVTETSKVERRLIVIDIGTHYRLYWHYVTPLGLELRIGLDFRFEVDTGGATIIDLVVSTARLPKNTDPFAVTPSEYRLPELAIARYPINDKVLSELPQLPSDVPGANLPVPQVHECEFYYCEMIRSASVRNGQLHDRVTQRVPLSTFRTSHCDIEDCGHATSPDGRNESYVLGSYRSYILAENLLKSFNIPSQLEQQHGTVTRDPEGVQLWWANNGNISQTMVRILANYSPLRLHNATRYFEPLAISLLTMS